MHKRLEDGFTVIEIMIGIALFGLIMPTIIMGVVNVGRLNDRAADLIKANIVAEEKLESLRNAGFNTLNPGTYDFTSELHPTFSEPRNAEYVVADETPGVKSVRVNITYNVYGAPKNLSFKSIISELGVSQ